MLEGSIMTITCRSASAVSRTTAPGPPKARSARRFRRSHVPTFIAAGAVALGGIFTATAIANAQPEADIKSECADSGGTYTTTTADGHTTSSCCYEGIFGVMHCDVYKDGELSDGDSYNGPPTKTKPPITMSKVPPPSRQ